MSWRWENEHSNLTIIKWTGNFAENTYLFYGLIEWPAVWNGNKPGAPGIISQATKNNLRNERLGEKRLLSKQYFYFKNNPDRVIYSYAISDPVPRAYKLSWTTENRKSSPLRHVSSRRSEKADVLPFWWN